MGLFQIFWPPLSRHGLANGSCSFGIGQFNPLQQAVGADPNVLGDTGKAGDAAWEQTAFDAAEGFPVNFDQLGQTFLGQAGLKPRPLDIFADTSKNLTFIHWRQKAFLRIV